MRKIRLRTKFLLSLLAISAGFTTASLLVVSYRVKKQVRESLREDLRNSVNTYTAFARERETTLARAAHSLANLPIVRALMTTQDTTTIQDEASNVWRLSGSDLLVFADRTASVAAVRSPSDTFARDVAQTQLTASLKKNDQRAWWFGGGRLYEVYIQPIYFGATTQNSTIGFLAVGHAVDDATATNFSAITSSEVVFRFGELVVAGTLTGARQDDFLRLMGHGLENTLDVPREARLGAEKYLVETVRLFPEGAAPVTLSILKSFDKATAFLNELNRVLLALGLVSVCAGSALVFLISHTFTRPLGSLVAGVRALQEGNFAHPLEERGGDEVAEVTSAFSRMRASLQKTHDEQKLLEERLRQAHKMEAVGRLAGGVAHDFNNLLTIIRGNGDLLADRGSLDDAQKRCVEQIQKAAGRAVSMTRQLLAFSRMQVLQPVVLDLNGVVSEMGKMLPRLIGEHIEYIFSPEPQLKPITADPGQIEQVILNLAVNAHDAMPNGGTLTVGTTNVSIDVVDAARRPPMSPGDYVLLSIADTGYGMDPETKAHIFEPFFTTKEVGKGTGLGLATVYGIVKQSGGFIWVQSSLGKGTTFEIYLPQASGPVASASPEAKPAALPRGTETILVVEDEPDVRDLASRFLNDRGYNVLTAKDGAHALEVFAQYPGKVHLILTDLVMPRMSGKELCKRVKALRPEVKVLFMSGYADYAHGDPAHTPPPGLFLQKPFSQAALVRFVRNALASGSGIEVANTKDFRFS